MSSTELTSDAQEMIDLTEAGNHQAETETVKARGRSEVAFPYDELGSAISVVRLIAEHSGDRCALDQLAGQLGQKTTSGSFRMKITAARIFGLVTATRQGLELTDLGHRIVQNDTAALAKVDAFLTVPLYERLHERFKGKQLPPTNAALESVIRDIGVAPKQVRTARWRFQKSAETAGFFEHGRDRLVAPAISAQAQNGTSGRDSNGNSRNNGDVDEHPLIVGLLQSLPPVGEQFSAKQRDHWLNAVKVNFDFIYGPAEDEESRGGGQQSE